MYIFSQKISPRKNYFLILCKNSFLLTHFIQKFSVHHTGLFIFYTPRNAVPEHLSGLSYFIFMQHFSYILFYKPFQVLSQFSEEGDKKTLAFFFPDIEKNIYPVGRLDYESEGLLLLTNDKKINHRLLDPGQAHQKTYYVQVEGVPDPESLRQLEQGVTISVNGKTHKTRAAKAILIGEPEQLPERNPPIRYRKHIPTSWISLTITEGKNRQVRKMTAAVGFPTLRLIRYRIGNMSAKGMSPGDFRMLNQQELRLLFEKTAG